MTTRLMSPAQWFGVLAALVIVAVGLPVLNLVVPADSVLHLPDFYVSLIGKILCYAICALAIDLIWGYAGILSLGHGLFFALGGYAMGMYLMRQIGREGQYRMDLPDFMVFLNWKEFPWHWAGSDSFVVQALLVVLVPGALAFVFGFFAFRSRIKGVYFSIITQALTFAAMLLFFRNETGFGGNNGFTDFKRILDIPIATPQMRVTLAVLSGLTLIGFFVMGRAIVTSKFGRVLQAIRDAETRVMFTGYDPVSYKLAIWTLSAMMCAIAGALYVPQVGIINPSEMSPAASIEMAIWAAVGGRGTLIGPIVGAFFVNGAKSWFTAAFPEFWLYFLGALFIAVTLFLPQGLIGLLSAGVPDFAHGVALYVEDLCVSFDGFKALNNLSLVINVGELRCIIGPNGAGKTTMMDCITGKTRPDSGHLSFGSNIDLLRLAEADIAQVGIGRKFQKPTVYERLTVFENLELALAADRRVRATLWSRLSGEQLDRIGAVLTRIHLKDEAQRTAGLLSHGQKQWLEIGMLLMQDPKLLLLDEPVAGMTDEETARTAELFLKLKGKHSLMVVEHDMSFVRTISEIVTVLCDGSVLAQGTLDEVQADERVIEVYLGR
jgi:urea transport system permease protein